MLWNRALCKLFIGNTNTIDIVQYMSALHLNSVSFVKLETNSIAEKIQI